MLAELEDLLPFGIVNDLTRKVGILVMCRKLRQFLHVIDGTLRTDAFGVFVFNPLVPVEHGLEHLIGRLGIGTGTMGAFQLGMAEEPIGPFQRTRFHLHEDVHHIDKIAVFQVKLTVHPQELLHQHREVELQDVVACQVGIADKQGDFLGFFTEGRLVGHHQVSIAMHRRGFLGDVHLRIEQPGALFLASISIYFQNADFNNAVMGGIQSCGLQVEKGDRPFQVQFHGFKFFSSVLQR